MSRYSRPSPYSYPTVLLAYEGSPVRGIANVTDPFVGRTGEIHYSSIDAKEAKKFFQGEIVFK